MIKSYTARPKQDRGDECHAGRGSGESLSYLLTARPFLPTVGETYDNLNGSSYLCTGQTQEGCAIMRNLASGWTMVVHRVEVYSDGRIEWGCSTSGHFER